MKYSVFSHLNGTDLSGQAYKEHIRRKRMISHLSSRRESTIPELAEFLKISIPKTTELASGLLAEGLIREAGVRTEGIGRKATIYSLNQASCYFLGIEIKKYKINIGVMGFDKTIVDSSLNIPFPFLDPRESLSEIVKITQEFLSKTIVPREKIIAMGLSIPGRINVAKGEILTIYHFEDAPVKKIMEEAIGLPVYIDNDSRTIAYGEYYFGKGNYGENVIVINLDYGLGTGIFIDSKPVYGASGYAGELGHIPIFDNEKICLCGKKGCMQTEASGFALINYIVDKMKEGSNSRLCTTLSKKGVIELEDIVEAVRLGDNLAVEAVREVGFKLGKGLAVAINLFNPNEIVLAGLLSAIGDPLLLPVQTSIFQHSLSIVNTDTKVVLSKINTKAELLGCCLLVRDKTLGLV